MKNILAVLALLMCFAVANNAVGQDMTKEEKKEWKKRIKQLSPEQYKALLEENKSLKGQLSSLKKELAGVDQRIKEKDDQIEDYQDQVSSLRSELASAKKRQSTQPKESTPKPGGQAFTMDESGVLFKVQIGAFKGKDLTKFAKNNPAFQIDKKDGTMRYTLGMFRDYWEADTFKKYIREMGIKDAWIVAYKDGNRVPIKDVLEGVI